MAWGSVNVPGGSTQGADGKSAYELAVENGYSGTLEQWLASLKGDKGADGDTGPVGATGQTGPAGPGLPAGGTAGQVPVKKTDTDYDTEWKSLDSTYLTKENPKVKGVLTGACVRIGEVLGGVSSSIGYRAYADKYDLSFGENCIAAATYGEHAAKVISCAVADGSNRYTLTIDKRSTDSSFWNSVNIGTKIGVVYKPDNDLFRMMLLNVSVKSIDKDAATITILSSSALTLDIKYIVIYDNSSDSPWTADGNIALGNDIFVDYPTNSQYTFGGTYGIGERIYTSTKGTICIGFGLSALYSNNAYGTIITGRYNNDKRIDKNDILIVGGGEGKSTTDAYTGINCFRITKSGSYGIGAHNTTGADYAEQFEWLDGNPNSENRIGLFVTLDGEKIRLATSADDFILGIISGNPSVVGDSYDDQWQGMYVTDIFGRFIWEDVQVPAEYDEEGNLIAEEHTETRLKINPNYNSDEKYIPRSQRKEWATVGMMGKLTVIDDGTCQVNGWANPSAGGVATASTERTKYRVMSRLDDTHVRVLIL